MVFFNLNLWCFSTSTCCYFDLNCWEATEQKALYVLNYVAIKSLLRRCDWYGPKKNNNWMDACFRKVEVEGGRVESCGAMPLLWMNSQAHSGKLSWNDRLFGELGIVVGMLRHQTSLGDADDTFPAHKGDGILWLFKFGEPR